MASNADESTRRSLGLGSAAALIVANMLGAGVFTTSGFALADLGDRRFVMLAWLVAAGIALCGAVSYGGLARRIPRSGGEYTFLAELFHPGVGFLAGFVSLLAGFTAPIAAAGLGLQAYLSEATGSQTPLVGSAAIVAAGLVHGLRARAGIWLTNVAVLIKLAAIFAFVTLGAAVLPEQGPAASTVPAASFDLAAFATVLVWISFSYSGWNAVVYVTEEIREPDRVLPRALLLATLGTGAVYLALNAVFLFGADPAAVAGRPDVGAIAAEQIGGLPLRRALSSLVALALFTSISAMVMAGPRVYARMAEDGLFPRVFGASGDVPPSAIALQVVLALVVLHTTALLDLIGYIGLTLGLSAAATVIGAMRLRLREGAARVPIPGFPWVPAVFVAATLGSSLMLAWREPRQAAYSVGTLLLAWPVYLAIRRWRDASDGSHVA